MYKKKIGETFDWKVQLKNFIKIQTIFWKMFLNMFKTRSGNQFIGKFKARTLLKYIEHFDKCFVKILYEQFYNFFRSFLCILKSFSVELEVCNQLWIWGRENYGENRSPLEFWF